MHVLASCNNDLRTCSSSTTLTNRRMASTELILSSWLQLDHFALSTTFQAQGLGSLCALQDPHEAMKLHGATAAPVGSVHCRRSLHSSAGWIAKC